MQRIIDLLIVGTKINTAITHVLSLQHQNDCSGGFKKCIQSSRNFQSSQLFQSGAQTYMLSGSLTGSCHTWYLQLPAEDDGLSLCSHFRTSSENLPLTDIDLKPNEERTLRNEVLTFALEIQKIPKERVVVLLNWQQTIKKNPLLCQSKVYTHHFCQFKISK